MPVQADWPDESGGKKLGVLAVIIPGDEALSVLFRTRLIFDKPIRVGLHRVSLVTAVLAPFKIGGKLFVADEAVVPGVRDGDFQQIFPAFDCWGNVEGEGRVPQHAQIFAVQSDAGEVVDVAEVQYDSRFSIRLFKIRGVGGGP